MTNSRVGREQVLAFRAAAHSLHRRRPAGALAAVAGGCGIQDTPAGNADVSLAARLDVAHPVVADAVREKRLVLTWSLRGAPHAIPPDDLAVFTLGARPADGRSLEAVLGGGARHLAEVGIDPADALDRTEQAMVAALGGDQLTKAELSAAVTAAVGPDLAPWCRGCAANHPLEGLFRAAPLAGRILLTSTAPVTLVRTGAWLGVEPEGDVPSLRRELLVRYLRCYGPSTPGDFAGWAGVGTADARERWAHLAPALSAVQVDGREAFVVGGELDRLANAAPVPGVRLLPAKDALLQARDRELLVPDGARRKAVFAVLGGPGVVLVDGEPAGTWRGAGRGKRYEVRVQPFAPLAKQAMAALDQEAQRVAAVRGHQRAEVLASA